MTGGGVLRSRGGAVTSSPSHWRTAGPVMTSACAREMLPPARSRPVAARTTSGRVRDGAGAPGAGGSFAFADPDARLGYAYVMNKLDFYLSDDPREQSLRDAIRWMSGQGLLRRPAGGIAAA